MTKTDYFKEAMSETFEENNALDIYNQLSEVQRSAIAEGISYYYDNIGMAFPAPGGYGVQKPSDSYEVKQLKERITQLEKEVQQSDMNFRKNVAMRRGCDVSDVVLLKDGHAEIR